MNTVMKDWIDNASYQTLLQKWRHAPSGDPIFAGEIGGYYSKVMNTKKRKLTSDDQVRVSKAVGW